MLESAWLFLGVLGVLATAVAVGTDDNAVAMVAGTLGFVVWGVWTFGTLNVETVSSAGTIGFEMPAVTLVGVALALVPGFIALTGPVEVIRRVDDTRTDDI